MRTPKHLQPQGPPQIKLPWTDDPVWIITPEAFADALMEIKQSRKRQRFWRSYRSRVERWLRVRSRTCGACGEELHG